MTRNDPSKGFDAIACAGKQVLAPSLAMGKSSMDSQERKEEIRLLLTEENVQRCD